MSLWGGRFEGEMDHFFQTFNATFGVDCRLFEADIKVSLAYVNALNKANILTREETLALRSGLESLLKRVMQDPHYMENAIESGVEDVHSFVESELKKEIGEIALKLNTGRSRNDQVVTDLRLWLRESVSKMQKQFGALQTALIAVAEKNIEVIIPGYTHLQRAQPVLWAHHVLAYFQMFQRDKERLHDALKRMDVLPLGSGALSGNSFGIDRDALAKELGFSKVSRNSMDSVSDRDFVLEIGADLAIAAMHLSRLAEDLILFSTTEFGFLRMGDSVTTGSSLMPQKKNPDAAELIRGKTGRVFGNHVALLTLMKALPLTYNKDMAEDKEALFDSIETVNACLCMMRQVVDSIELDCERIHAHLKNTDLNATEVADYLVRKNVSFREAHNIVGRAVLLAGNQGKLLSELPLEEWKKLHPRFDEAVFDVFSVERACLNKNVYGGTARNRVGEALKEAKELIG